uniref:Uncharacterized protein n=1 Tax=Amphimedon queenslandica TaxID=400682 RepID=A0A1X7TP97_AMPQE
ILSQDIEMFSSAVSECVSKGHYQSSSMTILNRTLIDKNRFVKENFVNRQRIVQFSIEFFTNYKKLLSTMEHCQAQFSSHECGQSLADIQYQQDFLKELKDSLHETVNVVKSQANHLLDIYLGSEQELETSDNWCTESNTRILVTPKKISQDSATSVWSHQFNRAIFDGIVHKIGTRLSRLNRLCESRLLRLDQSKDVIQFEAEVPKMLKWLDEVTSALKKTRNDYGDSIQDVQKLLQDHETFSFNIVSPMHEKIGELKRRLAGFEKSGHYDLNRIRSIGSHLEQQWVKFNTDVETRLSNLKLSLSFQENSFNANNWCVQSEQFVQTLNEKMSSCDTATEAKGLKDELSIYLSVTKEEQLDRVSKIKEISGFLHSNVLSEVTAHLNQVTEQTLKEFSLIDEQLASLHVKLCQIEEEKDKEMRLLKQKKRVIEELIATEEVYVQDLKLIVETYKPRFVSEFLPDSLKGKETIVFGNIQWIAEFHIETLWPQIQSAEKDLESLAQVFIDNAAVMTDLYVPYCQNKTKSEDLLAGHRSYLTRVSSLFGTDVPLSSLLIKPIQRITRYPLLLADCLKYTRLLGHDFNLLQLAVKAVEEIPIQTNNAIHLSLLKCEEGLKWHKFGELLYQGLLLVSEPRLLITTEKERHVFLFENTVVFARKIDLGQAKFSYEYKFKIPLTSGVQIIENIDGEPLKFAFFTVDHRMHLKCSSIDVKKSWVRFMKSSIQKHIEEKDSKLRSLSISGNRLRSNAVCTSDALAKDLSLQSSPYLPRRPSSPFSKTRIDLSKSVQNSSPPVSYKRFRVKDDYIPLHNDQHGLLLKKNQIIEVMEQLDTGRWFVQATSITGQVEHGWVPSSMLEPVVATVDHGTSENWSIQSRRHTESSAKDFASHQVINALKKATLGGIMSTDQSAGEVDFFEGTEVGKKDKNESIEAVSSMKLSHKGQGITPDDINSKLKRKGVVRKRSSRTQHTSHRDQGLSSGDDENFNTSGLDATDEQVKKAREKIQYIMAELYETEVEYVNSLQKLVDGFIHNIVANPTLPEALQGKEKMIFGNVSNIYEFHKYVFQELLEKAQNSLEAVAQCFLDKHSEFKLYVSYCENKPKSESFIWTYIHQGGTFFKDLQLKLGFREDIASFLIRPVQRITKYQLLLKDLLKSSQKAGWNVPLLEQALQLMQDVPKQANDAMALSMIVGYHGNIHANGQIVLQDEFTVYERARWAVGAHRHVFLLDLMMIITKEKDNDGLYVFKDFLKVHNMTLTEKQADSPCRFAVGTGQIGDWDKYYILEASSTEKKQEWIRTIKEILNQQFEMLKALKQPSARSRSSTVEIDILPQKRCSPCHDSLSKHSDVLQDMSDSSLDELGSDDDISSTGNQENGTEEATKEKFNLYVAEEDCPAPIQGQYIFNLKKGQVYDVINSMGDWWLARILKSDSIGEYAPGTEGWVPRTFMAPYCGESPILSEPTKDSKFNLKESGSNARHSLTSMKPERSKKKSKNMFSSPQLTV